MIYGGVLSSFWSFLTALLSHFLISSAISSYFAPSLAFISSFSIPIQLANPAKSYYIILVLLSVIPWKLIKSLPESMQNRATGGHSWKEGEYWRSRTKFLNLGLWKKKPSGCHIFLPLVSISKKDWNSCIGISTVSHPFFHLFPGLNEAPAALTLSDLAERTFVTLFLY